MDNYKKKIKDIILILSPYKKSLTKNMIKKINSFIQYEHNINDENLLKNFYIELKFVLDSLIENATIKIDGE